MGEVERCSPTRVLFTQEELANFDKEQLLQHWSKQENYINWMESQLSSAQIALTPLRDLEEKLRHSISSETARRESFLLLRLNSKEQEIQDLIIQIQELKASQAGNSASMRSSLLDPAVNVLIQHLRKELDKAKLALEETQNELSAWKFTPDSNTGKRLMAKCRLLYQENEELGRMISSGRMAKLEGDLALQRNFSEEMKKSQSELDEFLLELDEDVEGMQSTIYFLQQQLRQTREQLAAVQKENEVLRNSTSNNDKIDSLIEARLQDSCHMENLPNRKNLTGGSFYHQSSSHLVGPLSDWCNGPQSSSKRNFEKILEHSVSRQVAVDTVTRSDESPISELPSAISNPNNSEKGTDDAEADVLSACHSTEESVEISPRLPEESSLSFIGKRDSSRIDAVDSDVTALDSKPRSSHCTTKSSEDTPYHRLDAVVTPSTPDYHHRLHTDDLLNDTRGENEMEPRSSSDRFSGRIMTNIDSQDEAAITQLTGEKKHKLVGSSENGGVIFGVPSSNLIKEDENPEQTPEDDEKKTYFRKRTLNKADSETISLHNSTNSNSENNCELSKTTEVEGSFSKLEGESSFTKRSRIDLTGNSSFRANTD